MGLNNWEKSMKKNSSIVNKFSEGVQNKINSMLPGKLVYEQHRQSQFSYDSIALINGNIGFLVRKHK